MERASLAYHDQLTEDAVAYLTGPKRGLSPEIIDQFRLGVVADPLPGHEAYRGFLTIPYLTSFGIVTIRYRRLGDPETEGKKPPKYLTMPGDQPRIFNPADLELGTRGICLTEGEFDGMVAKMCDLPVVGFAGSTSWLKLWARLLNQYDQVMLLQDDDDAGRKMADQLGKELRNLRPVVMSGGDTTSFFLAHGRDGLRGKVLGT